MSLNLAEKKAVVAEVNAQVKSAQIMVIAEERGVSVADMTRLRAEARKSGIYLHVLKNTLVRRAVHDTPFAVLSEQMVGPLLFGIADDPVVVAKVMSTFAKSHDNFILKAGAMPNQLVTLTTLQGLADLPSREVLLSKLLGTMQAPLSKFMRTLNEVPSKFVRTLAAVHAQKTT